ncbi:hypothetical protein KKJ09_13340 [Xenorhabdus bovienii]|uniref:hypothetical protein n=1 Tax=Xenorhabdus bovienii TaxID=40576 RepID=UPI0023B31404|nr:hypothetical protein [Xenorhabdus bovienii]MDE9494542.1 hypothetical protein [Xenorhabdus bovienii]MDE9502939.1 hypothetical protein [Xenorhabdus bovienii]MDE9526589.1 hypothetical protein [Xenorhabdus bovienii]
MENVKSVRKEQRMPLVIDDADFNRKLRMPSKNTEHTEAFLANAVKPYVLPEYVIPNGYRLVKSLKKDQFRMVTNDETPETVYLVELNFRNDIIIGKSTCTQIKVWRTVSAQHQHAVSGFPRVFFKHLLDEYSIVVTDEQQTSDGKRFWETMISWALEVGFSVYASDGTEMDRPLTAIGNLDEFYGTWDEFCWGYDKDVHTHRLVVISKSQLEV